MQSFQLAFLFLGLLFFQGCQTPSGVVLTETSLPIKQSRMAVTAAIGEARAISQNGREISSHYHDRKLKYLDVTPKTKERLYTKVIVLGARRPYDIEVQVHIEQRDPDTKNFHDIGLDDELSLLQAKTIQQVLNQSREKIQTIDDGAPF